MPLFNLDLPLPPRPDSPAPRGLLFPGNPDPRPYITDKNELTFNKSPKEFLNPDVSEIRHFIKCYKYLSFL